MMLVVDVADGRHIVVLSSDGDEDINWDYWSAPGDISDPGVASEDELVELLDWLKQTSVRQAEEEQIPVHLELWFVDLLNKRLRQLSERVLGAGWVDLKPSSMTWAEFLQA